MIFENQGRAKQVKIDGTVVSRVGVTYTYTFRSTFEFTILDGSVKRKATLEYELSLTGHIKGLRLTIDKRLLHAEGTLRELGVAERAGSPLGSWWILVAQVGLQPGALCGRDR